MVDRSPLPCDANCLNAQKNGSARAAASRAAADLVAEPPQLLRTRDPEEPTKGGIFGDAKGVSTRSIAGTTTARRGCRRGRRRGGLALRLSATAPDDEHRENCEQPK